MTDSSSPPDVAPATAPLDALLAAPPRVVNIGLPGFAEDLAARGASVVHVKWQPPAGGDPELRALLAKMGG